MIALVQVIATSGVVHVHVPRTEQAKTAPPACAPSSVLYAKPAPRRSASSAKEGTTLVAMRPPSAPAAMTSTPGAQAAPKKKAVLSALTLFSPLCDAQDTARQTPGSRSRRTSGSSALHFPSEPSL